MQPSCNSPSSKLAISTYDQMLQLMRKGFIIDDEDECINFLERVSYYRLKAYYLPFRDKHGNYFPNIHFSRIERIYYFDQAIRNIIFAAIETIETQIRSSIVNYFSLKYGSLGYKDPVNFNSKHNHIDYEERLSSFVADSQRTLIAKHYINNYAGVFPMWAIAEFFSIGFVSHFYLEMKTPDKKHVAKSLYGVSDQVLESWLRCLTDLRNKCAHYSRLYYWIFTAVPSFHADSPAFPSSYSPINSRRLFAQLYMLKLMFPDSVKWNAEVVAPIAELISNYTPDISLIHIGFPPDWMIQLTK